MNKKERLKFKRKVVALARKMNHKALASTLGITVSRLQNWIYKDDVPDEFTVMALSPTVETLSKTQTTTKK